MVIRIQPTNIWSSALCDAFIDGCSLTIVRVTAPTGKFALPAFNDLQGIIRGTAIHNENFHIQTLRKYGSESVIEKSALVK